LYEYRKRRTIFDEWGRVVDWEALWNEQATRHYEEKKAFDDWMAMKAKERADWERMWNEQATRRYEEKKAFDNWLARQSKSGGMLGQSVGVLQSLRKFCRHCGASIPRDSNYCERCGMKLI
jgi:hypothetical protein